MKLNVFYLLLLSTSGIFAQQESEQFQSLPFGSIQPRGWIQVQMQNDLNGFVGHLDELVPDLINDPIYGSGRLQLHSKAKDLGNLKSGDAAGDDQYKWWNSETQSNWWDGYIRHVLLLQDAKGLAKVNDYVNRILATQDADGYLGIYDPELRYRFQSENGELWAKATLYRGLLAYYEYTHDIKVLEAVTRAVQNVMDHYPIHQSSPFSSGNSFNGGVSHGLTFTDVLERLYFYTHNPKYRDYAVFLYEDFSATHQSETDAQLESIRNPKYRLKSHGVHTYEHLRALIIARYSGANPIYVQALSTYLHRIQEATTASGGPIGDEWIAERIADATHTGYEYCSLHELLDSYGLLYQKEGKSQWGDRIEHLFYNAALGARHPEKSCIAYLKTDNSYEMMGTKNGEIEPDRKQTRYKYSPAHQDVAVCCSPNAGRITPYFIQNAWMKENESALVATLLLPCMVQTTLHGRSVQIENTTAYPFDDTLQFTISQSEAGMLTLKIRRPHWASSFETNEKYAMEDDFIVIQRHFAVKDSFQIRWNTTVQMETTAQGEVFYRRGALLYALPIPAREHQERTYKPGFTDFTYNAMHFQPYRYVPNAQPIWKANSIQTQLFNSQTQQLETVTLIPFGKTILRQLTFLK
ncbi:glycoside hydrolase family 127 protein [Flavobacterium sp. N1719]|uniref:glycoside hydrolase family 127 protein n=1 Tax=Flavobacterium sp. N1719 TaxID=2885633 RepID=UPI00222173F0|nr:glycoside hydrolase family 127 protein [Flavobacterium sp. N1719]